MPIQYRFLRGPATAMLALTALSSLPNAAYAGAWTAKEDTFYNKLSFNYFSSDKSFGGNVPGQARFTDANITYYLEYGITDSLTFFGSVPYKGLTVKYPTGKVENGGIGDVDLGLRYQLLKQGSLVVSTSLLFKAPYLYSRNEKIPFGNRQEDVEGRLLLGYGLGRYGYLGAEVGYRYRAEAPADEFRYLLEYGFNATDELYLRAKFDGNVSQGNSKAPRSNIANPNLNLAFDLTKLELTTGWKIDKSNAIEFSATPNTSGRNTLKGTNYSVAWVFSN